MAMLDAPLSSERSYGIDVLRGVLALWVLFCHLESWARVTQGDRAVPYFLHWFMSSAAGVFQAHGETNPAVLGFIVLSGYCIHRNGLRREEGGIGVYFIRRAFRIYPIYLLAVLWGVLCFTVSMNASAGLVRRISGTEELSLALVLAKLAGISDFVPSLHALTFQGNAPLHTVMVEIGLYVLYPALVVILARKHSEKALWAVLLGTWGLGTLLVSMDPGLAGWWHNGSVPGYLLYWWIGAKFLDRGFSRRLARHWYLVAAFWILATWLDSPVAVELRKAAFALLIGVVITRCDGLASGWKTGLERVGRAGYSVYALHAPLVYTLLILGTPWYLVAVAAVSLGLLTYTVYENPLNQLGRALALGAGPGRSSIIE
jgi:peptidoglycan/LPS O-acetylase OafA/YrhL